jgi:hypothetical protein
MGIYTAPYVLAYTISRASLNTYLKLAAGTYKTEVQEWDNCGGSSKTPITLTVSRGTTTPPESPPAVTYSS